MTHEQKLQALNHARNNGYVFDPDTWEERYNTLFTLPSEQRAAFVDKWFDDMAADAIDWLLFN